MMCTDSGDVGWRAVMKSQQLDAHHSAAYGLECNIKSKG